MLNTDGVRWCLAVAHPGHELAVHGWLERVRPTVFTLTDGSGHLGISRVASTTNLLAQLDAAPGAIYGQHTDHDIYAALLAGDTELFVDLAGELATSFHACAAGGVAGEAAEGYSPVHDVWRMTVNAAVELVRRRAAPDLLNYEFTLFARQASCPAERQLAAIWLDLDDAAWRRKLAAARRYPELAREVEAALTGDVSPLLGGFPELAAAAAEAIGPLGKEAFLVECLRSVPAGEIDPGPPQPRPFYESYGENLVASGKYAQVIRYRQHLQPVGAALRSWLGS